MAPETFFVFCDLMLEFLLSFPGDPPPPPPKNPPLSPVVAVLPPREVKQVAIECLLERS
jgi:hypothetical protein